MTRFAMLVAVLVTVSLLPGQEPAARPAAEIIREFRRIALPSFSSDNSPEGRERFRSALEAGCRKQAALALELYRHHPGHAETPRLLGMRWAVMTNTFGAGEEVIAEVGRVLEKEKSPEIRKEAYFAAMHAAMTVPGIALDRRRGLIDRVFERYPDDVRCGHAYARMATDCMTDPVEMRKIAELVLEHWSEDAWCRAPAQGLLNKLDRVGKVLELDVDALNEDVRVPTVAPEHDRTFVVLRGTVWDREKRLKEDRAIREIRDSGARVVEIFCWKHEEGAEGLRAEIRERGIDWPVHYAGETMKSPTKGRWATNRTPLWYALDEKGRVTNVGHDLDLAATLFAEKEPATAPKGRKI